MNADMLGRAAEVASLKIPMHLDAVPDGFPSPASDYSDMALDLNTLCNRHPAATCFVRAQGESMAEVGIFHDDVLVVDRSLTARHGDIVIAEFNGELTANQLELEPQLRLVSMNKDHAPEVVPEETDLTIFGVVTNVIHSLRKP